jgi:hypothetical protein
MGREWKSKEAGLMQQITQLQARLAFATKLQSGLSEW